MALLRIFLLLMPLLMAPVAGSAEAPTALPREVTLNGVELVVIPAGWFWYTVSVNVQDMPVGTRRFREVRVWLDNFYLAKYEARASDLVRFMNSGAALPETLARQAEARQIMLLPGAPNPPDCTLRRTQSGTWELLDPGRDLPATDLSWMLAVEFAAWMGLRLPTEAEWEKGARGTDKREWSWGAAYTDDTYSSFDWTNEGCRQEPVDAYPKGRSPYGLFNMGGNVSEYVMDWFNQGFDDALKDGVHSPPLAREGSAGPFESPERIIKGGSWTSQLLSLRIGERRFKEPYHSSSNDGVRFAADIDTVRAYLARQTTKQDEK